MKRTALLFLCWCAPALGAADLIIPRVATAPEIDGQLGDAAWGQALRLSDFTMVDSHREPAKAMEAKVCVSKSALYFAIICQEPRPSTIRATAIIDGEDVWKDDCVELWIRTTPSTYEFDQFIVNTTNKRETHRRRQDGSAAWAPTWRSAARVEASAWAVEVAVPFQALDMDAPKPGDMVQLKLGREDHTERKPVLTTWPAGSSYGGLGEAACLYFESSNLLPNPDLSQQTGGKPTAWGFSKGDERLFSSQPEGDRHIIVMRAPGRYSCAQQSVRLKPHARYRLEAHVKGTAGIYLRARTKAKPDGPSIPHTVSVPASESYRRVESPFPTGPTGRALIIIGNTESYGAGEVRIANLRLVQEPSVLATGPAIPVPTGGRPTVITKILTTDCRALRGFIGTPVDGTRHSRGWNAQRWEYNQAGAGAGVGYEYNGNDGLHITLAPHDGIDAVLIRGGARCKLYTDCERYDRPATGKLAHTFPGRTGRSRASFASPLKSTRLSFFELSDGRLADVSFLHVSDRVPAGEPRRWSIAGEGVEPSLKPWLRGRFAKKDQRTFQLVRNGAGGSVRFAKGETLHFMTPTLPAETPIAAIAIEATLDQAPSPTPVSVAVQDPLNPRSQLFSADLAIQRPGLLRLVLDFPDQVVPKGRALWLTVKAGPAMQLSKPFLVAYVVPRSTALVEALPYRKLLLKSYFCAMSEARRWMRWSNDKRLAQGLAEPDYGDYLTELKDALDHCKDLGPDDDTVRQFYEWILQRYLPNKGGFSKREVRIDPVPGAPQWAVVLRQAWLEARAVPKWWIENRMVPTGEFGGRVGDDSDMYQNYIDLAMLEDDGVAAQVMDGAARLAELAEETCLERGLNKRTIDPLHAYEEGLNQEALMAWWEYGDPVYLERCIVAARSTEALTVVTSKGHRHFKSQLCGAADLKMDRKTDVDGHAHPLMWHPALEVADYNRSPLVMKWLREWADGWLEHMEPGRYATSVEVATEKVTATTHRPLYGGYGSQGSVFEWLYWLTDEQKYIGPFLEAYRKGSTDTRPGSIEAELLHRHGLESAGVKLSNLAKRDSVAATLITGDKSRLVNALKEDLAWLQRFPAMYTTAEQFTDRIFLYALRNVAIAYTGGYATRNKLCHTHAVSWQGFSTQYAALVLEAKRDRFRALVYSFAGAPLCGSMTMWTLDHGKYHLTVGPDRDGDDRADEVGRDEAVEVQRATRIPLTLAPKTLSVVELKQTQRLDDERDRPDLALNPLDTKVEGSRVQGVAHNIGARDVASFVVTLVDPRGDVRMKRTMGPLSAPTDLVPKCAPFRFEGRPADTTGWSVVIDPADLIEEIYEGNNKVVLVP